MFILGDEVRQFEESFAALCQTKYAVGVANGTDAFNVGDEIIWYWKKVMK